jgi:hypothetical protein
MNPLHAPSDLVPLCAYDKHVFSDVPRVGGTVGILETFFKGKGV